jgi:hypothetical protein
MNKDETDTWHMEPAFKPTGHDSGAGWIVIESWSGNLPVLGDGFLGIVLKDESADNAGKVAAFLSEHVKFITFTGQARPEWADQPGRGAVHRRQRNKPPAD